MKEIKVKSLLINIILFISINNIFGEPYYICSKYMDCSSCYPYDIIHNSICEYHYLYCLNNNHQLTFYNDSLKSYYINYFYNNPDIKYICGEQNIYLNEPNFEKIIEFRKNHNSYLNKSSICCNYEFNNNLDNNYDIYLSISKIKENIDKEDLNFDVFIHLPNSTILNIFNHEEFSGELINLKNVSSFSLMIV